MDNMITFKEHTQLNEGVNDPAIFKAIFLAGGPGSGKSFVVGKTALQPMGFKLINSDTAFEVALKKVGLTGDPEDIISPKGQEARTKAKAITKLQMEFALAGRLGLVIDGTGKDLKKIMQQAVALKKLGYDVSMIFVNSDEDTAQYRNKLRSRTVPSALVSKMWKDVQKNIGGFQAFFGNNFHVIDNSEGSDFTTQINNVYKKIMVWAKKTPKNPAVSKWVKSQKNPAKDYVSESTEVEEGWAGKAVGKLVYNKMYKHAANILQDVWDRKKSESTRLKHGIEYYAAQIAKQYQGVDARELAKMVTEAKDPRIDKAGVSGFNKAKRTPSHPTKSHIVVAKDGNKIKTIRFGEQGASTAGEPKSGESDKMKAKRKSFKARHGKNIAKGKMSAAYWADKEKW